MTNKVDRNESVVIPPKYLERLRAGYTVLCEDESGVVVLSYVKLKKTTPSSKGEGK